MNSRLETILARIRALSAYARAYPSLVDPLARDASMALREKRATKRKILINKMLTASLGRATRMRVKRPANIAFQKTYTVVIQGKNGDFYSVSQGFLTNGDTAGAFVEVSLLAVAHKSLFRNPVRPDRCGAARQQRLPIQDSIHEILDARIVKIGMRRQILAASR